MTNVDKAIGAALEVFTPLPPLPLPKEHAMKTNTASETAIIVNGKSL